MKILLIKCQRNYLSHFEENSESLALAYLAAILRQNSFEVDILDASLFGLTLNETIKIILKKEYRLIGFTIADPTFIESTFRVINILRQKGVKAHITIGGQTPTFHYKEILEMCAEINSVVMHEGEITIVELANALLYSKDWHCIMGIAYRNKNGFIKKNPPRPLISDLNCLPFPARDTILFLLEQKKDTGVVSMSGGRGCYMNCGFCSIKSFYSIPEGQSWRFRSYKNIIDEMEYLIDTYDITEILLVDDVFVGPGKKNIERIFKFADEIEKRKLNVMISISERVDNINRDLFKRLREIGLRQILLGIESGSQEILDYFNKGITLKQILKAIETLDDLNIDVTVSFINFTPITTLENLRENLSFFLNLKVNILQGLLNRFQIYSGTPIGDKLHKNGIVKGKFPNFSYVTPNKRVDIVYDIVQKSFGTFLAIAYELKKIERDLRIKLFKAEANKQLKEIKILNRERIRYKKLLNKIMEEATVLFRIIIDFVESKDTHDGGEIFKFTDEIQEISISAYKEWFQLMQFFRSFCPAMNSSINLDDQILTF